MTDRGKAVLAVLTVLVFAGLPLLGMGWAVLHAKGSEPRFTVEATVVSVLDGDTLKVQAAVWPDVTVDVAVRLRGIDTPEKAPRAKCEAEALKAAAAGAKLRAEAPAGARVVLTDIGQDKYAGRVVALVSLNGRDLSEIMLEAGLARPYGGGTKSDWCQP